jgi:hypothetical protein
VLALWAFVAPGYAAQPELTKLTVGYSPISAATLQGKEGRGQRYLRSDLFCRTFDARLAWHEAHRAIKFLDHPKAKQLDPKQTFNNNFVEEALR